MCYSLKECPRCIHCNVRLRSILGQEKCCLVRMEIRYGFTRIAEKSELLTSLKGKAKKKRKKKKGTPFY